MWSLSILLPVLLLNDFTFGQNIRNKNVHCDEWNENTEKYYDYHYGYSRRFNTKYECVIRNYKFTNDREYYIDKSQNVENLKIVDSFLENLPMTLMIHLTSLNKLIVRNTTLSNVDEINFGNVTELEFSSSKIVSIKKNTFSKCKYLQSVNLSKNSIKDINFNAFADIKSLKTVDLSHNQLTIFNPDQNFQAKNFSIILSFNKLSIINLKNISEFNCGKIHAENNEISEVSLGNAILTLETLNLNNNKLGNNLQDICKCTNLYRLSLKSNDIDNIGSCFSLMKSLKWIDLSENKMFFLDHDNFHTNNEIEYLNLSFNRLETVDEYTLSIFRKLKHLYLQGNLITNFYENPKFLLPQLKVIGLSHNKFKCSNLFLLLTKCKSVSLTIYVDKTLPINTTNIDGVACYRNNERELLEQSNSTNFLSDKAEAKISFLLQKINTLENNVNKMTLKNKQEDQEQKLFNLDVNHRFEEITKMLNKKLDFFENTIKNSSYGKSANKNDKRALTDAWNTENNFIPNIKPIENASSSSSSSNTLMLMIVILLIVMVSINLFIVLRKYDALCFYRRRANIETPLSNLSTI
ncbi:toll-like receptor 3 [Phlebotomus papatasi]|uniref:toll-like receptor 3 n=1 Tax=Phlebotomus papatasi TaxID=29031 RepID=UPI002483D1D8|nr:toll-like receptor 3 [Phlebotomus papatasi]